MVEWSGVRCKVLGVGCWVFKVGEKRVQKVVEDLALHTYYMRCPDVALRDFISMIDMAGALDEISARASTGSRKA